MTTATALHIARTVYPDMPDNDLGDLALLWRCWNCTGYPVWWQSDDPESELKAQLEALRETEKAHA